MLCDYGCGNKAKYKFKNGMNCCSLYHCQCPAMIKKQKNGIKEKYEKKLKDLEEMKQSLLKEAFE